MHMICHSMPIPALTELNRIFLYFVWQTITALPFWHLLCWRRGTCSPAPQPAATEVEFNILLDTL